MLRLLDRLPEQARQKLLLIDSLASDADDLASVAQTRLSKLARLSGDADNPQVARLAAKAATQADRHRALFDLADNCQRWVRALPPQAELEPAAADPPPPLADGETVEGSARASPEEAVVRLRRELGELVVERMEVQNLPEPRGVIMAAFRAEVRRLAAEAARRLDLTRGRAKPVFADPRADFGITAPFVAGLLSWLLPEAMDKALGAEVERAVNDAAAKAADEQEVELRRLGDAIEELQPVEEALISQAFDCGVDILRRPNADPPCVLGVRVATRPARRPRPPGPFIEQSAEAAE
jgi:hypothetical protein